MKILSTFEKVAVRRVAHMQAQSDHSTVTAGALLSRIIALEVETGLDPKEMQAVKVECDRLAKSVEKAVSEKFQRGQGKKEREMIREKLILELRSLDLSADQAESIVDAAEETADKPPGN